MKGPDLDEEASRWRNAWRELAQGTAGITDEDPRFDKINSLLDQCDKCYSRKDWAGFLMRKNHIERLMKGAREERQNPS